MKTLKNVFVSLLALLGLFSTTTALSLENTTPQQWYIAYHSGYTTDATLACNEGLDRVTWGWITDEVYFRFTGFNTSALPGMLYCNFSVYQKRDNALVANCYYGSPDNCTPAPVTAGYGCLISPAAGLSPNFDPATGECWTPGEQKQYKDLGECCSCDSSSKMPNGKSCVGNPLNPANGNKFQKETDYVGNGPYPLTFQRYYNSRQSTGPFLDGFRWRHTYMRSLKSANNGNVVVAMRPDGRALYYNASDATNYWTPTNTFITPETLTRTATGWTYLNEQDETETYDTNGRLLSMSDRHGLVQTMVWTNGQLSQVTDPVGRTLAFGYANGRLSSLTDPAGKLYQYTYDSNGNLAGVTYPDGKTRQYVYEKTDLALKHALTGIIDENGARYATWDYTTYLFDRPDSYSYNGYSDAYAISSEHAGGADKVTLTPFNRDTRQVTVTDAFGTQRVYGYQGQTYDAQIVSVTGAAVLTGGLAAATSYSAYAGVIGVSRTEFNGTGSNYGFDTKGREVSRNINSGDEMADTTWHATYHLPTQINIPGYKRTTAYFTDRDRSFHAIVTGPRGRIARVSG